MDLKKNILATLAYYDVLDFPLREEEIFKYLMVIREKEKVTLDEIKKELGELIESKQVFYADGYYYLFERDYLVPLRLKRTKIAEKKMERARRVVWWLGFLPYVKAVFTSGSLALANTDELSDLDVLVVAKHGRIWTTRLLISGMLTLFGRRRKYNQKIAPDKICLNHYITDKSLLIPFKSVFNAQTYINLKPIFVSEPKIIGEFFETNLWLGDYILNFEAKESAAEKIKIAAGRNFLMKIKSGAGELILNTKLGDLLEAVARRWQTARIKKHRKQDPPGGRVVYNDDCLEFHPGSVEEEIIRKYESRIKKLPGA